MSHYVYPSSSRGRDYEAEHYVYVKHHGDELTIENLPDIKESKLTLNLKLDGRVVSGTWEEQTSLAGPYKGRTYHGVIQMVADDEGKKLNGRWLGFGHDLEINHGTWQMARLGPDNYQFEPAALEPPIAA